MPRVLVGLVLALNGAPSSTKADPAVVHYGPIASTSPDQGTCGNSWANDSFNRVFRVRTAPEPDGTFQVEEDFRDGNFVTVAGQSPGACETGSGGMVGGGLSGRMGGSFSIVVSGGTFDADAVCTQATCGTTAGFIATVFGPSAVFIIQSFNLHYVVPRHGAWKNASPDRGGNHGDITGF
jgi:hypothetical protein